MHCNNHDHEYDDLCGERVYADFLHTIVLVVPLYLVFYFFLATMSKTESRQWYECYDRQVFILAPFISSRFRFIYSNSG